MMHFDGKIEWFKRKNTYKVGINMFSIKYNLYIKQVWHLLCTAPKGGDKKGLVYFQFNV